MHRINLWTLCAISHTEFLPHYMRIYAIYRVLTPKHYVLIYALVNLMDIYNGKYILVSKPYTCSNGTDNGDGNDTVNAE